MVKGGSDGSDGGQVIIDEPTTPPSFPRAQFKPSSTGYRTCFARPRVGSTWPRPRVVWVCRCSSASTTGCTRAREKSLKSYKVSFTIVTRLTDVLSAAKAFHPRFMDLSITMRHDRFPAHRARPVSIVTDLFWACETLKI